MNERKAVLIECNDMPYILSDFNSHVVGGCEPNAELDWLFNGLSYYKEDRHYIPANWSPNGAMDGFKVSDAEDAFEMFEETLLDIFAEVSEKLSNRSFSIVDIKSANLDSTQVVFVVIILEKNTVPI